MNVSREILCASFLLVDRLLHYLFSFIFQIMLKWPQHIVEYIYSVLNHSNGFHTSIFTVTQANLKMMANSDLKQSLVLVLIIYIHSYEIKMVSSKCLDIEKKSNKGFFIDLYNFRFILGYSNSFHFVVPAHVSSSIHRQ